MKTSHIIDLVSRVRAKAGAFIMEEFKRHGVEGLVPSHGAILDILYEEGEVPMKELARRIGRDKSTVTTLVAKLVDLGYVKRSPDPGDGRVSLISLTGKGIEFRGVFDDISKSLIGKLNGCTTRSERDQFTTPSLMNRSLGTSRSVPSRVRIAT